MSGSRKALIVANDEYEQDALRDLRAPAADAEALARVLGDPEIGDFAVQTMHNQPSWVIQAQIEELLSEAEPAQLLSGFRSFTSISLAQYLLSTTGDVLGLLTAVLVAISWNRSVEKRRTPAFRLLPVLLLGSAVLIQVFRLVITFKTYGPEPSYKDYAYPYYASASAAVLVTVGLIWYALRLRSQVLGGLMMLGWFYVAVILFAIFGVQTPVFSGSIGVFGALEAVFLGVVLILIIVYLYRPPEPEQGPEQGTVQSDEVDQFGAAGRKP